MPRVMQDFVHQAFLRPKSLALERGEADGAQRLGSETHAAP